MQQVRKTWPGVKWIIEFDIKGFFDNINHEKLIEVLEKKIDDNRLISLIRKMLKAGYMEDWKYGPHSSFFTFSFQKFGKKNSCRLTIGSETGVLFLSLGDASSIIFGASIWQDWGSFFLEFSVHS